MKERKISKILFLIGMFLLSFIFFNIFLVSTFLLFKVSVQPWYFYLSFILSIIINMILLKKNRILDKKSILLTIVLPILIIIISLLFSGLFKDYSWDGSMYHKIGIGYLAEGYNPVYEDLKEYDSKSENSRELVYVNYFYAQHYAKASYMYGSSVYKATGNIEHSKSINIISIISLFLFSMSILIYKKKKLLYSVLFSLIIISPTTIVSQYLTNYVDVLVYVYMFMLIYSFYLFENNIFESKLESLITYFIVLNMLINIKFSSFGYAGIFCLGYFIWYIIRLISKKIDKQFFIQFVITSALAVIIGVFVIGLSTYYKNYVEHSNPFYPLMGKDKIDIMTSNSPDYFQEKEPIEKFIISTFSKAENIGGGTGKAKAKIPFTIYKEEIMNIFRHGYDMRISGNGLFFSGIFIISLVSLIIFLPKLYKEDKNMFYFITIPIIITIGMIIMMQDVWWARYFPQLHFIVFSSVILLQKYLKKEKLLYIFIGIIIINNMMFFIGSGADAVVFTHRAKTSFKVFEEKETPQSCSLILSSGSQQGAYFNIEKELKDYNIEYSNEVKEDNEYTFMWNFVNGNCKE